MPQYVLTRIHSHHGMLFTKGTVLSTDAPPTSIFYIAPDEADQLFADGILASDTTPVLTGARDSEPGWTKADRATFDARAGAREEGSSRKLD